MVSPVKGSGIGQVNIQDLITRRPQILQGLDAGLGTSLAPPVGSGSIGLSQMPLSGAPDIMPSDVNVFEPEDTGFSILTPRARESGADFLEGLSSLIRPGPQDEIRQARARGQIIPGVSDEVEAMAIRDASDAAAAADAAGQKAGGEETARILREAAEGKTFGEQTQTTTQGETTAQSGIGVSPSAAGETSTNVPGADTPAKQATVQALDEYLKTARPGVKPKEYADYIKEFSDATGLDVSGQPDNSTALMAFGLALMQNKAGKGFNVGRMLGAVGEAGEKALPELTKARSEARALRAKAGQFAMSRKKEDEAAARNRQQIYVVPRTGQGKTERERLQNRLMQGRYISVNSYEFDALVNAEGFDQNYEVMPGDVLGKMGDLFKGPESRYMDSPETITLFENADGKVDIRVRLPKAGNENLPSKLASSDQATNATAQLNAAKDQLDQTENRFNEFAQAFSESPPNAVPQAINSVVQFTSALGFLPIENFQTAVEGENAIQKQKRFLEWVSTSYAPEILRESGKTISDADRERVNRLVGQIKMLEDPRLVAARVNQLHTLIIKSSRAKLAEGYRRLNEFGAGVDSPALSEDQRKELNQLRSQVDTLLSGDNQT